MAQKLKSENDSSSASSLFTKGMRKDCLVVTLICRGFMRNKPSPAPPLRGKRKRLQEGVSKVIFSSYNTAEETGPGEGIQNPRS